MNKAILLLASLGCFTVANAAMMVGVTEDNHLVRFDSTTPGTILSSVAITGTSGVVLDFTYHPATGLHYGVDINANVYSIAQNGVATLLNGTFTPNGFDGGLGYDPFAGGLVFASDAAEHYSITHGGVASSQPTLVFAGDDLNSTSTPSIFGLAFDPDFGTAFLLDKNHGLLTSIDPNLSELLTVGSLGLNLANFSGDLTIDAEGNLFAALSENGVTSGFYSINPNTGAATLIGNFNNGINAIAVESPAAIPEPSVIVLCPLALLPLLRRRRTA